MESPQPDSGAQFIARPAVRLVAVLALLALLSVRLLAGSGETRDLTPSELARLPVALARVQPAPVSERVAAACLDAAPGVASVRSDGERLFVQFADVRRVMEFRFLADENAAIRATNANPDELGNFVDNTIWLQSPADLGRADFAALGRCIPDGSHHQTSAS